MSLIDMSEVRPVKEEKKKVTVEDVKKALKVYAETLQEGVELRYDQMQKMAAAMTSKIAPLPGQPHPAQELNLRLQFLDKTMVRLTDMITAGTVCIDYENDPSLLNRFPRMLTNRQNVMEIVVAGVDKKLEETTPEEAMAVAGFRDLERFYKTLSMVNY
jgi:hypothetical protein